MNETSWFILSVVVFECVLLALFCHYRMRHELGYTPKNSSPLYYPRPSYLFLFIFLLHDGRFDNPFLFLDHFVKPMLVLSIYFGLVLLALPLLRKVMRAESCATLWDIAPAVLLTCFAAQSHFTPLWVIPLPLSLPNLQVVQILVLVWLAGFAAVMIWSIVSHLIFRRRILRDSQPIQDESVINVFSRQAYIVNFTESVIRLRTSRNVKTPLSIGLWSTILVLPERSYTAEDLELIFHHELVHICRMDSFQKLFMRIFTAVLWFNPLMWLSTRICAEDIELSCDEAVLHGESPTVRRKYADLLLQTAADSRGFTTCLSSSAKSLRYRLRNVMNPGKKIFGTIVVGMLCLVLMFCILFTGIRFRPAAATQLIDQGVNLDECTVGQMFSTIDGKYWDGECKNEQALLDYLRSLPVHFTPRGYDVYDQPRYVQIDLRAPEENYRITFGGRYLQVQIIKYASRQTSTFYYELDQEPDWQFLRSCIQRVVKYL